MRRVVMLFVLSSLVGATIAVPQAGAGPDAHNVTGSWRGFFQIEGVNPPDDGMPASFEVLTQEGRRFSGLFTAGDLSCMLDGTISESLQMGAQGDCGPMSRLVVQGQATDTNDFGAIIPCIFEGRWMLTSMGGNQRGDLVLLHDEGGPTELVAGRWEGEGFDEDGNRAALFVAEFTASRGGTGSRAFINFLTVDDDSGSFYDVFLDLTHPPDPDSPSGFALVGGGSEGLFVFSGQYDPPTPDDTTPATIEGTLTLLPGGAASAPPSSQVSVDLYLTTENPS